MNTEDPDVHGGKKKKSYGENADRVPFERRFRLIDIATIRSWFLLDCHIAIVQHHMDDDTKAVCVYLVLETSMVSLLGAVFSFAS